MASRHSRLDETLSCFKTWLHMPDTGMVEVALATYVANRLAGDPVWMLLNGAPSSGKTETLNSLIGLPDIHSVAALTEAGLLSGSSRKDCSADATGGLLREIGQSGIVVVKDFGSILSMNRDKSKVTLAALREVYDGNWTRAVGTDGGRKLSWKGKVGLIGAVTSAIDSHYSVMNALGQRFAQFRLPKIDAHAQALCAIEKTGEEEYMRVELAGRVKSFFDDIDFENAEGVPIAGHEWLIALSTLAVTCPSAVDRNGWTREIENVHDPEGPARLTRMLAQLMRGMCVIGLRPERRRELIVKIGLDCIPPVRRIALEKLMRKPHALTLNEIADGSAYPDTTIRRALEELECYAIVERLNSHAICGKWQAAKDWKERFETACGPFPKCY